MLHGGITVVVCVKDDWRVLRLLDSLTRQSLSRERFSVLVISTGVERYESALTGIDLDLEVIHSTVSRHAVQRNIGLSNTATPYFCSTDADCVAHVDWLADIAAAFAEGDSDLVGVGGSIAKYRAETTTQRYGITIDDGQATLNYLPALDLPYITGANAAYRTADVKAVNGYDEQFLCGEDVDLSYKLGLSGGRLKVIDGATIFHEDRESLREHFHRFRFYAVDQALLVKKYRDHNADSVHFNPYPWARLASAMRSLILPTGDDEPHVRVLRAAATCAEALGVLAGDLQGSVKHRTIYI